MFEIDENTLYIIISIFLGITYGVIAQQKQFCFSGGIKDLILFKHTRRTASLIVAITTAILSTQLISYLYNVDLTQSKYYLNINYLFIVIGGLMFGYGMMISDGCSSRHLIKFSQGDKESLYILISLGLFSYFTFTLISTYWDQIYSNSLVSVFTFERTYEVPLIVLSSILFYLLYLSLKKCMNFFQVLDGFFIGILISIVWYITSVVYPDLFIDISNQSLSFVYPIGKLTQYIGSGFNSNYILFSVLTVFGVIVGAFISSKFNKKYSKKQMCDNSQQNPPSLFQKLIGGAFMGIGGILAIGCTVGQGLSGISTLSFASLIAIVSIYISGYITAKIMKKQNALIACFVFDFECKRKQ